MTSLGSEETPHDEEEEFIIMDAWVKATSLVLSDKKLTKELANMILLP